MDHASPISIAGRHELIIAAAAAARGESLDVKTGDDILLHLKPKAGHLVVNSRVAGRWGGEHRIQLPRRADDAGLPLTIELAEGAAILSLEAAQLLELPLTRPLDGARLVLSDHILKAGQDGVLHGQIARADSQHLSGLVQLGSRGKATALEMRADGRSLSRLALMPDGERSVTRRFSLPHPRGALVYEGMWIEMLHDGALLDAVPLRSSYVGVLEHCSERSVSGWVRNPALPASPLVVDVYMNGRFQGSARANKARTGTKQDGSGFVFRFPKPLPLLESREARVSVRVQDSDLELVNSPWWVCRPVTFTGPLSEPASVVAGI